MFWVRSRLDPEKSFKVYSVMHKMDETWFLMWASSKGWVWLNANHFLPDDNKN